MKRLERSLVCALVATPALLGAAPIAAAADVKVISSAPQSMGKGKARLYVALDASGHPLALGVSMDKAALEGLPTEPNATSRCFDKNGNGKMDAHECIGDYERVFTLPAAAAQALAPFEWASFNWNPHGHMTPAPPPWAEPHFDFHFYTADREAVKTIRPGPCGELIHCDDFKKATRPVPAQYMHPDHINVDAAVPDMGNHLINVKAPELQKGGPRFTHTFIYGAYDGQIIFLEPMITHAFIASGPDMCAPIKQPKAWQVAGSYPTKYCVRHLKGVDRYTVSIEGFVKRDAQ
ncbi:MAG: hypothetical protein M5U08_15510 [Burkholderiales bacterium]|nr:hypothetical protein [Burkholderiales bacterium]